MLFLPARKSVIAHCAYGSGCPANRAYANTKRGFFSSLLGEGTSRPSHKLPKKVSAFEVKEEVTTRSASVLPGSTPKWASMGALPARLLKKTCLVEASSGRLPVYTLTFSNPIGLTSLGVRMSHGDVVNVCIPEDYKQQIKDHRSHSFYPTAQPYSMSAERPGEFDITVKVYPGGRVSGYLGSVLQVGETLEVFKAGQKHRRPGKYVGIVAYGVGITEAFPIAKAELEQYDAEHVKLLWANKTMRDTFWHEQFSAACQNYPGRFSIVNILSREQHEACLHGRISCQTLSDVFDVCGRTARAEENEAHRNQVRFLVVGTKQMMTDTNVMFKKLGYPWLGHSLLRAF